MKKIACLLSLIMLFVSLSGCAGSEDDCCEDLERNIIASDTVTIEPDSVATVTIKDFEDSQESYARELMKSPYYGNDPDCDIHPAGEGGCEGENLTFEEALEVIGGNATHNSWGYLFDEQWADYEGYEWEVILLSESGKYDVLWLDVVESIRLNNHGDLGKINAKPALTKKGMTGSNSLGPKLSPDHSCGEVFDNYVIDCSSHAATYKSFTVLIANTGSTAIELEYSIFGWTGEVEEATERFELASGTAESRFNGTILASQYILDWEDSLEAEVSYTMEKENMTYEEAIEHLESQGINSTHSSWGHDRTWEEQWDDYEQYSWEIVLVSGTGTWDVLWMDYETRGASMTNSYPVVVGDDANWSSVLNERGMSSSGSKGPLDKPEQSCTFVPSPVPLMSVNQYGMMEVRDCTDDLEERHSDYYHLYIIANYPGGDTDPQTVDFVIEWTIYGWK